METSWRRASDEEEWGEIRELEETELREGPRGLGYGSSGPQEESEPREGTSGLGGRYLNSGEGLSRTSGD